MSPPPRPTIVNTRDMRKIAVMKNADMFMIPKDDQVLIAYVCLLTLRLIAIKY